MKIISAIVILISVYLPVKCQVDPSQVTFRVNWTKGDTYFYRMTKIQEITMDGNLIGRDSIRTFTSLHVLDSISGGYFLQWSLYSALNIPGSPSEIIEKLSDFQKVDVIYRIGKAGEFQSIENWEYLFAFANQLKIGREKASAIQDSLNESLTPRSYPPLESQEDLEYYLFPEIAMVHQHYGTTLDKHNAYSYKEKMAPTLRGIKPMKAQTTVYIDPVLSDSSSYTVVYKRDFQEKGLKKMLKSFIKSMGLEGKASQEDLAYGTFETFNEESFQYALQSGIFEKIDTRIEMFMDIGITLSHVEVKRIELIGKG